MRRCIFNNMQFRHVAILIAGIVLIALAAIGAYFFVNKKQALVSEVKTELQSVPDIIFKNIDGQDFSISSLKGRLVVVHIWASWCSPCIEQIPDLLALQEEFSDVIFVELNRGETLEVIKKQRDQLDRDNHLLFIADGNDTFYKETYGFVMPEIFFLDKNGMIKDHVRGIENAEALRRRIQDISAR